MTGESLYYKNNISLYIGQYCQVNKDETPHNSNKPRTKGAIFMGPRGNMQGRFKFISLRLMKRFVGDVGI